MESWAPLGPPGKGTLMRDAGPWAPAHCPVGVSEDTSLHRGWERLRSVCMGLFQLADSATALPRPHPPALRREEEEKGRGQDPQPLLPNLPSSLYEQNLQTSGLKQITSLWFPALTTLQVHRLLGWGRTLVPGVFPSTCRSGPPHHPAGLDPGHTNTHKQLYDMDPTLL